MKSTKKAGFTPEQTARKSGEWFIFGSRGGKGSKSTVTKGATFAPTPTKGSTCQLARAAKNGEGR